MYLLAVGKYMFRYLSKFHVNNWVCLLDIGIFFYETKTVITYISISYHDDGICLFFSSLGIGFA